MLISYYMFVGPSGVVLAYPKGVRGSIDKTSFQGGDEKDYPQPVRQSEPTGNRHSFIRHSHRW